MKTTRFSWLSWAVLLAALLAATTPLRADGDDPPERVARLGQLQGTVSIQPAGVNQWSQASSNYPVATGDRLYADQDGRVEVQIGQTIARLWHNTDLTMTNLSDNVVQLGLSQGTLRLRTYGLDRNSQIEVDTPNGALTVVRPGDVRIDAYPGDEGTVVTVNSGEIQLSGPDLSQNVGAGQSLRLVGTNPIDIASLDMPDYDEFDNWSIQRDRHILNSASARYVSREASGYDDLDDYGDWQPESDYGPVWYPRAVPAGWVPYRYGHWVWTGPWGWTWVEDEPWGYAPFHYGRWVFLGNRWGWVPGPVVVRPVWSPALVAFVGGPHFSIGIGIGGGGGVAAWFPLGPGEPYYPWYHCSPRYVNQVNITNIRVTKIVNVQNNYYTNIHNVTNIRYVNQTVAVTAVKHSDFATARPVAANVVRVAPEQLRQAVVVPHPDVKPTVQSMVVRPVRSVPVPSARPVLLTQGGRQAQAVAGAKPQPVPYRPLPATGARPTGTQPAESANPPSGARPTNVVRPAVPAQTVRQPQPVQPQPVQQPQSAQPGGVRPAVPPAATAPRPLNTVRPAPQGSQGQPRPLVQRNEWPAPRPTFQQQQPALGQHPGRPLEPQQMENLRQGHPAGPQRDQELIPHPQAAPRPVQPRVQAAPHAAPPAPSAPPVRPQQQRGGPPPARDIGDHRRN